MNKWKCTKTIIGIRGDIHFIKDKVYDEIDSSSNKWFNLIITLRSELGHDELIYGLLLIKKFKRV